MDFHHGNKVVGILSIELQESLHSYMGRTGGIPGSEFVFSFLDFMVCHGKQKHPPFQMWNDFYVADTQMCGLS